MYSVTNWHENQGKNQYFRSLLHFNSHIILAIHNFPWFKRFIGLKIYFHRKMQK